MTLVPNHAYEILTPDGWKDFAGIQKIKKLVCAEVHTECGKIVRCSPNHRLLTIDGFKMAMDLTPQDTLVGLNGVHTGVFFVDVVRETTEFYDVCEVGDKHEFLTDGLVSHNCQFMGGSNALFSSTVLSRIPARKPISVENRLDIHEEPKKGHRYVITVDPSEGAGQDYSAFSVIDVTELPYKLVAKYRDNTVSSLVFPRVIYNTAVKYNKAYVLIETNSIGSQIGHSMFMEYEYEYLLTTIPKPRQGPQLRLGFQGGQTAWGLKQTVSSKAIGCANLKSLVENGKLQIEDYDVIEEASKFTYQGKTYKAEEGEHDDLIMSLVLFGWLAKQPMFTNLTNINVGARELMAEESEQYVPFLLNNNRDIPEEEDGWVTIEELPSGLDGMF